MKRNILILSIFLISSLFQSCSDFLDRASLSALSNDTFWQTEQDANRALAGCYDALQKGGLYSHFPGWDAASPRELEFATDNGFFLWTNGYLAPDVLTINALSPTSSLVFVVWGACYTGIARCNEVIEHVPEMTEDQINRDEANKIVSEAKFLRALLYNHLTSLYRDVPLTLNVLTVATSQIPKSPRAEVIAQIVSDLKEITGANMLPETNLKGRATRGAALALLTRVYLYNEMYSEAAAAAKEVINMNKYSLEPSFESLFTGEGNDSNEIIFAVQFENTDASGGEGGWLTYNWGYPMEWITPYQNLADDFHCIDGLPISSSPLYDPDDDSNRDPRLGFSIITPNSTWQWETAKYAWWFWNSPSTLYVRKFQSEPNWGVADNQDYYVLRYADVLLMRAEALAKAGQDKNEIMNMINQIRQRPDVMMPKVEDAEGSDLSYDQLFEIIKHERRVELAFEGYRYFDLLRWKDMEKAYAKCRDEGIGGSHIFNPEKDYVWPVPLSELDNNKALVQAPEWGGR